MLPYWLQQSLMALPLALWVYAGIGIPWALVALPRSDWRDKPLVLALACVMGPMLLTAWMFVPGVIGGALNEALLRFDVVFSGTLFIAGTGIFLAWRKSQTAHTASSDTGKTQPLALDEKILIAAIVLALILRWFVVAYWPFTAYDALWVYGYQGKLYFLEGLIPQDIGYYPQFLQLQYTFMQLGVGAVDDHAARIVVPFLHLGSVLTAYIAGARLFRRRVGIFLAALWALYPHVSAWSHVGDLEIPLTFLFTLTAVFFLMAWTASETAKRRRYALLAGVVFGVAMWTKPTAGAFIWGVVLLVVADLLLKRFDWRAWWPRFEVAAITGLACLPLGALWYLRNIALGLPPLVFPHESWLIRATRSGDLFGWPLLALGVLLAYVALNRTRERGAWALPAGLILLLAGLLPSVPFVVDLLNTGRLNPPQSYINLPEMLSALAGLLLIAYGLRPHLTAQNRADVSKIGWAWLLILPYFMTWFYSYSYHYRLSFVIVPLLMLPTAALLAMWFPAERVQRASWRSVYAGALVLLSIPLILNPLYSIDRHHDWLWTDRYPDDGAKYILQNPGVYQTALHLYGQADAMGHLPTVVAPGEQRLQFFMPEATIITDTVPTTYDELQAVDATHFIYGSQARWRYENDEGIDPLSNRLIASLGRQDVMTQLFQHDSGTFRYELYRLHLENSQRDYRDVEFGYMLDDDSAVTFGDLIRYRASSFSTDQLAGTTIGTQFIWDVVGSTDRDYRLVLELVSNETDTVAYTWERVMAPTPHAYYTSRVWQPGELIRDRYHLRIENPGAHLTPGESYRMRVRFVDTETGESLVPAGNPALIDDNAVRIEHTTFR